MMQDRDAYRHRGMRKRLVADLREKGIHDEKVLEAIMTVPRHFFFDLAFEEIAYRDQAFPIGEGQTISQPFTVSYQTQLLAVKSGDRVLEIGTGSGYQAAILAAMGAEVHSVERWESLHLKAQKLLKSMEFDQVHCYFGDGQEGLASLAPFDKILITAAAEQVPKKLLSQVKIGGLVVAPLGHAQVQRMHRIRRLSALEFEQMAFDEFRFVPLLSGKEAKRKTI
jgi:protein-L-isoaspartate(D-aspartate) O-methyltransferase